MVVSDQKTFVYFFFFQAEDGIRDPLVTGVQTCALPICGVAGAKVKDEDWVQHIIHTSAHAYLLFFSSRGRVYRLKAHEIPMKDRTARGTAIINLLALQPGETIQSIIDTRDYETNRFLFFCTKKGQVKKTKFTEYDSSLRAGLIAINARDDVAILIVTDGGYGKRTQLDKFNVQGRGGQGVRGIKITAKKGHVVAAF